MPFSLVLYAFTGRYACIRNQRIGDIHRLGVGGGPTLLESSISIASYARWRDLPYPIGSLAAFLFPSIAEGKVLTLIEILVKQVCPENPGICFEPVNLRVAC